MNELVIALLILSGVVFSLLIFRYLLYAFKYKYRGNLLIYTVFCFLVCFCYSLYANFFPAVEPETSGNPLVLVVTSIFDTLKMMVVAFDKTAIGAYFFANDPTKLAFGIGYVVSSIASLALSSMAVILLTVKNFRKNLITFFKKLKPSTFANALIIGSWLISLYGFWLFLDTGMIDYMLAKVQFAFLDFKIPLYQSMLSGAVMLFSWAFIGFLLAKFIKNLKEAK